MKKIDVLDFDGTLYKKDSSKEFFKFCLKKNPILLIYIPKIIIYFFVYYLGGISITKLKECFFAFLKNCDNIDEIVEKFWKENRKFIRMDLLKKCKNEIVIISASPMFIINYICSDLKVNKVIATNVDKKTGKFLSANCKGTEKITRLNCEYDKYCIDKFYSDSYSDEPLAKLAKNPFFIEKDEVEKWNFNNTEDNKLKELIRYVFIGVLTIIITLVTYYILTIFLLDPNDKLELQIANFASWLLAVLFSYVCNRKYVFNSNKSNILKELLLFISSRILTLIVDMLGMFIFVSILKLNDKIIKILVQILVILLNYIISKFIVFNHHNKESEKLK